MYSLSFTVMSSGGPKVCVVWNLAHLSVQDLTFSRVSVILAITYCLFHHLCFCFTDMEQIKDRCSKEKVCPAVINLCYCKCNKSFPNSVKCKTTKWKRKEKKEGKAIKKSPTFKKEIIIWAPPHASKYFTIWLDDQAMTWSLLTWLTVREGNELCIWEIVVIALVVTQSWTNQETLKVQKLILFIWT